MTLAEMYVQGVSTRKVKAITEKLCGTTVSSTQVSKATAKLDETLEAWRNRPLGIFRYLFLDARYEIVRQNGHIQDAAVLIASCAISCGKRVARSGVDYQRRSSGTESCSQDCLWRCSLAAVPVPSPAERSSLCAKTEYEIRGSRGSAQEISSLCGVEEWVSNVRGTGYLFDPE